MRNEGLHSLNDFYLLAERKTLRFVHTYIMLIEYIDGVELCDIPDIDETLKIKFNNQFVHYTNTVWYLVILTAVILLLKMVKYALLIFQENGHLHNVKRKIVLI
ncbi:lipopolysaccharide core heptose(II) kinase rfaY [Escherichia coli DEC6D]|nr:lipopolysaccharide core heptose(II) kinase rfaY [Escherichia coli DEC6D]